MTVEQVFQGENSDYGLLRTVRLHIYSFQLEVPLSIKMCVAKPVFYFCRQLYVECLKFLQNDIYVLTHTRHGIPSRGFAVPSPSLLAPAYPSDAAGGGPNFAYPIVFGTLHLQIAPVSPSCRLGSRSYHSSIYPIR